MVATEVSRTVKALSATSGSCVLRLRFILLFADYSIIITKGACKVKPPSYSVTLPADQLGTVGPTVDRVTCPQAPQERVYALVSSYGRSGLLAPVQAVLDLSQDVPRGQVLEDAPAAPAAIVTLQVAPIQDNLRQTSSFGYDYYSWPWMMVMMVMMLVMMVPS